MIKKTPLYQQHINNGAKLVNFSDWLMPIHYDSQLNEHHTVRQDAGVFDVSHMSIIDITGPDSKAYLRYVLANDVEKLTEPGKALYSCMLNEAGGIIDDLIAYFIKPHHYRLVTNAGTRAKVSAWLTKQATEFTVNLTHRPDLAILAVQGPNARHKVNPLLPVEFLAKIESLARFHFLFMNDWLVARTGYTGEDGYEIILPATQAADFWQATLAAGIKPCGLGARDTLRLEAGLNLYGADMDETTTPLEANLSWTIAWQPEERNFIGRTALAAQQAKGVLRKLVGLVLEERGVLRAHQRVVLSDGSTGEVTSGTFSPNLKKGIALARVPANIGHICQVDMRGKLLTAEVIKPPFVKNGKSR